MPDLTISRRSTLTRAKAAAEMMLALLNNLLDLAKIESGKMEIGNYFWMLRRQYMRLSTHFRFKQKKKGSNCVGEIPGKPSNRELYGDPLRLNQVTPI